MKPIAAGPGLPREAPSEKRIAVCFECAPRPFESAAAGRALAEDLEFDAGDEELVAADRGFESLDRAAFLSESRLSK